MDVGSIILILPNIYNGQCFALLLRFRLYNKVDAIANTNYKQRL